MADRSSMAAARRQLARLGGRARAKSLSREERAKIAGLGGKAGGRGRKKGDRLPSELVGRIHALIRLAGVSTLWYMSDSMKRPIFRGPARQVLQAIARNGSLDAYKAAHELLKCL